MRVSKQFLNLFSVNNYRKYKKMPWWRLCNKVKAYDNRQGWQENVLSRSTLKNLWYTVLSAFVYWTHWFLRSQFLFRFLRNEITQAVAFRWDLLNEVLIKELLVMEAYWGKVNDKSQLIFILLAFNVYLGLILTYYFVNSSWWRYFISNCYISRRVKQCWLTKVNLRVN